MIFGFDTTDEQAATAALLVYAVYRSRDKRRFKISLDMWDQIERFTKDSAKRSKSIPHFIEALKPRLSCGSISPRWMHVGMAGEAPLTIVYDADGKMRHAIQLSADRDIGKREFLTRIIDRADGAAVVRKAYLETAFVVLLVRDRLERERPIEQQLDVLDTDVEGENQ